MIAARCEEADSFARRFNGRSISAGYAYADRRQCVKLAERACGKRAAPSMTRFWAMVQGNVANLNMMLRGWRGGALEQGRRVVLPSGGVEGDRRVDRSQHDDATLSLCELRWCSKDETDYRACTVAPNAGADRRVIGDGYLYACSGTIDVVFALIYRGAWTRAAAYGHGAYLTVAKANTQGRRSVPSDDSDGSMPTKNRDFETKASRRERTR